MNKNKKISLIAGALLLLSMFLPYVKMGMIQASIFDVISADIMSNSTLMFVLTLGALFMSFKDNAKIARICFGAVLLILIYALFDASNTGAGFNVFDILGIGAYLAFISSLAGVIFSKEDEQEAHS